MKKSIQVKLDDKIVTVSKLPLGRYAELLKCLKELPKHIQGIEKLTPDQIIEKLPFLIAESLPDVINLLTIATPITREEAEELGLDEAVKLVVAVIEVNNYKEVVDNVKKVLARPVTPAKQIATTSGSIGQ